MQIKSVIRILGLLLMLFSLAIIPPIIVSIIYQDNETWSFFYALILILVSGLFLWLPSMQAKTDMKLRDGFIIVVLLFGNFSNILKEVAQGIKTFQEIIKK